MPEEESEEEIAAIREKMGRAAQLLLFKRHRQPGAKDWELKKALGRKWREIIRMFDEELGKLGLTVKRVPEGEEDGGEARFYVTMKGHPSLSDRTFGWRIDDMAALTIVLSYILSKRGKAPLKEIERILKLRYFIPQLQHRLPRDIQRGLRRSRSFVQFLGSFHRRLCKIQILSRNLQ